MGNKILEFQNLIQSYRSADELKKPYYLEKLKKIKSEVYNLDLNMRNSSKYTLKEDIAIHFDSSAISSNIYIHTHNYYELIFCENGDIEYNILDKIYNVKKGDIIIIPPAVKHGPVKNLNEKIPYERYALWFSDSFYEKEFSQDTLLSYIFKFCQENDDYIYKSPNTLFNKLKTIFGLMLTEYKFKKTGWQKILSCHTIQILVEISRSLYPTQFNSHIKSDNLVADIVFFIEDNLSNKITLDTIAQHFFVSKSTISHTFKNQLCISPQKYIINRRLEEAKVQIKNNTPLKEVVENCGFHDYSSFYKQFIKEYGVSPTLFRTENQNTF